MFLKSPPIVDRPIRFALVGCGRISQKHLEALRQHQSDAELDAVCDSDPQRLRSTVEATGARGFRLLTEMLEKTGVDIVALATPSGLHPAQTMLAAKAGRHVMTEKPMATRWQDGLAMVDACDRAGVHLFVVKQNRRNATMQLLTMVRASGAARTLGTGCTSPA